MKFYLTGFTGQVGSSLRRIFHEENKNLVLLGRKKPDLYKNETYKKFDLKNFSPDEKIKCNESCIIIHCAYDFSIYKDLLNSPNLIGTRNLIHYFSECLSKKFIYFSTPFDKNAYPNASFYQKDKIEIEKLFDMKRDLILCPSFIVSDFSRIGKFFLTLKKFRFPILIPSNINNIAPINLDDFVDFIFKRFDKQDVGKFLVIGSNKLTFRAFLQTYYDIKTIRVPKLVFRIIINLFKILPFSFISERLAGLLNLPDINKLKNNSSFIEIHQNLKQ